MKSRTLRLLVQVVRCR